MVSVNREDKIQFIKDGLSKGSLDNLLLTLETHPSGDVHHAIYDLWPLVNIEVVSELLPPDAEGGIGPVV